MPFFARKKVVIAVERRCAPGGQCQCSFSFLVSWLWLGAARSCRCRKDSKLSIDLLGATARMDAHKVRVSSPQAVSLATTSPRAWMGTGFLSVLDLRVAVLCRVRWTQVVSGVEEHTCSGWSAHSWPLAYLKASNPRPGDWFGEGAAFSGDGSTLVIGAANQVSSFSGIVMGVIRVLLRRPGQVLCKALFMS